ncbi:YitT family protein [Weissella confusa]|uniref:YitT family protein n=1 Tax=Weissella confusa TaxID=1583 RepID=A0A923NKE4_WEICO|nr:YitT family protein [Weissella confusa]
MAVNIPLAIAGWIYAGREFTILSFLNNFFASFMQIMLPKQTLVAHEPILACDNIGTIKKRRKEAALVNIARVREYGLKAIVFVTASVLVAISMNNFFIPNNIFSGGFNGVAQLLSF